jgi:hypothetical protein
MRRYRRLCLLQQEVIYVNTGRGRGIQLQLFKNLDDTTNPNDKESLPPFQAAMHYNWQPLFISFLIPSLFGNEQLVSGARIPPSVRRDISPETVDVSGLNVFREYICPNAANVRRQIPGTVAVPKDQLNTVLQQLQDMELTVLALINQYLIDGQLDSTDPSGVFVGSNGRVISISSPEPSSVDLDAPSSAVGSVLLAEPTAAAATFGNAAAPSTTTPESDSAAAPSAFLADAAASGTTTPDSESAVSSASPTEPATPTLSNGGIFAQKSATSETAPTSDAGPSEDSTTGYIFNAGSSKNVAVYFGQTPVTGGTTLAAQCADPNVDIVILAFVISTSYRGSYPQLNFGAACGGQTPEMVSEAPGLLSCPTLATDITTCQTTYGKKVFLSIGGADSQISFPTTASASTFATTMWNLFGPPGNADIGLRPFGTVQIDGFDVGTEFPCFNP